MDGKHLAFYEGTNAPCHFHATRRDGRAGSLCARTLVDAANAPIVHLGDNGIDSWKALRQGRREGFPAGKFVRPHGAMFDQLQGNIFVVEWVRWAG